MASSAVRLVIDDPENFHLLTTDMKEMIIAGAIATVNVQAALTRKNAVQIVQDNFTLRNNFTKSQIQFEQMPKSRFISLKDIVSRVGITEKAGYMARQETGGVRSAPGGNNLAIPTDKARGGNKGSPVLKKNYLSALKNKTVSVDFEGASYYRGDYDSASYRLTKAAYIAFKNRKMLRYYRGLYTINDFVKKGDDRISFKMDLIYNFKKKETFTPENQWLWPASEKPAKDVMDIFISQMKKLGM